MCHLVMSRNATPGEHEGFYNLHNSYFDAKPYQPSEKAIMQTENTRIDSEFRLDGATALNKWKNLSPDFNFKRCESYNFLVKSNRFVKLYDDHKTKTLN